jgi:hypothetical protein
MLPLIQALSSSLVLLAGRSRSRLTPIFPTSGNRNLSTGHSPAPFTESISAAISDGYRGASWQTWLASLALLQANLLQVIQTGTLEFARDRRLVWRFPLCTLGRAAGCEPIQFAYRRLLRIQRGQIIMAFEIDPSQFGTWKRPRSDKLEDFRISVPILIVARSPDRNGSVGRIPGKRRKSRRVSHCVYEAVSLAV